MSAFYHPSTCFEAGLLLDGLGLFASGTDVRGKADLPDDVTNLVKVVALVETRALDGSRCWQRTLGHDVVERTSDQFHVVPVGTVNGQRNGNAGRLSQQAALDALLAPVRRIRPRFPALAASMATFNARRLV